MPRPRDWRARASGRRHRQRPAYKPAAFARYIASRSEFTHVRTRHRSPGTNGVIERFFGALKYEYLYREEIEDGPGVAAAVERYRALYNSVRPHEAIGFRTPLSSWRDQGGPTVMVIECATIHERICYLLLEYEHRLQHL